MPIQHFPPPPGVKAPPLSFAARTGDLLYISGIPGFDEKRELPETFEAQFRNVVVNIKRVLDEAGGSFRDLVKVNVLLDARLRRCRDERALCRRLWPCALSRPHHLRGGRAARPEDADRDRGGGVAGGEVTATPLCA